MFIRTTHRKYKGKIYKSVSLIESYRENGKIKQRLISNITRWSDELVQQFKLLLKGESINTINDFAYQQGKSCGGLIVLKAICKQLGIIKALGYDRESRLALMQIIGRIINQGSRLKLANEWSHDQALEEILGIISVNEDDLYNNLDWLNEKQESIENKLFSYRYGKNKEVTIFLYDVTSSYFEGVQNELAQYGYNRDGKKGKMQIVIGLLCDQEGYPISIEVFEGNTQDSKTVQSQLEKLKERFQISRVVFVGDKGMIKSAQVKQVQGMDWHYITSITQPQIKTLIKQGVIQLGMFDSTIVEVTHESERYILRRNPVRKEEIEQNRESRINFVIKKIKEKNTYLNEHPKSKTTTALRQMTTLISKRKLTGIIEVIVEGDGIGHRIDQSKKEEISQLDGCYVIKTDVPNDKASSSTIHDRYKDLAEVEKAFRTLKTGIEEVRPIFVRKQSRTRGHVFVCMLAYMVVKHLWDKCKDLGYTLDYIIKALDKIQYITYKHHNINIKLLPKELTVPQQQILSKLGIELPSRL